MDVQVVKSKFLRNMFDQNTYVLLSKKSAIIIDAGAELEDVKEVVGNRKVLAVLLTHLHFDHFWNIDQYLNEWHCDVYCVEGEEERFVRNDLNGSFIIRQNIVKNIDNNLIKNYAEKLKIGEFNFDVIFTPGHTSDGVCLLLEDKLFTGDTVFVDAIGRTDLADSNPFEMKDSLLKIRDINFSVAYPGHYESATKEQIIKAINYYL